MANAPYSARLRDDVQAGLQDWLCDAPAPTPFQQARFQRVWYQSLSGNGEITPVFAEIHAQPSGARAYAVPLILNRRDGRAILEFADLGVTDYNLPLLGPAAPRTLAQSRAAWAALSRVLPPADLLVLRKMPPRIGEIINPLVAALPGETSNLFGSYLRVEGDLETWRQGLARHNRKELGRFWRVFCKSPQARFVRARSIDEAMRIYDWLEAAQAKRAVAHGFTSEEYFLDRPEYSRFYRDLLREGLASGEVILTALYDGEAIVAALYGLACGDHYAMVRISFDEAWAQCSPGRLVIERTMQALHGEGFRLFDFTTGNYAYKRTFETLESPLIDVTQARSLRGMPAAGIARGKAFLRNRPALAKMARRLLALKGKAA